MEAVNFIIEKAEKSNLVIENLGKNSTGNTVVIINGITQEFIESLDINFVQNTNRFEATELEQYGIFISYTLVFATGAEYVHFSKDTYLRIEFSEN